jgi:hypothetical protein
MTASNPSGHILLWRDCRDGVRNGPSATLGWTEYFLSDGNVFRKRVTDQINSLIRVATCQAIERGVDVTVAWCDSHPATTPADELEAIFLKMRPAVIICPERAKGDQWILSHNFEKPESLPAAAIQGALTNVVESTYPRWDHYSKFLLKGLLVRHGVSGEALGIVPPYKATPDDILNSVADDPGVREAYARWDRATPSSHRDLVHARLEAQGRAGIAPDERAPLYTGEVESYLLPVTMRMGRGGAPQTLAWIRRDLHRLYGEHGEAVLAFMLRVSQHAGADELREAAAAAVAA